ncbi:peroxiredoxin [Massilia glaciei]|uniref:Peroxiredoxin n=3 Tax=Pseudomonadati TaxID=3379134 RepID=A0A2U2HM40_9BURK|nr:peroxiredoxin [Massilia glaciei]
MTGLTLPSVELPSTSGAMVNLATYGGWLVLYCYPMTGKPGIPVPDGWAAIPGAAGCTPQSCSFRDSYGDLQSLGVEVFGMSTQTTEDQVEAFQRLQLPYALLADSALSFAKALGLPTFDANGKTLLKRVTCIAKDGKIVKHFYPVFPADRNAAEVHAWLSAHAT